MKDNDSCIVKTARVFRCEGRSMAAMRRALFGVAILILHASFFTSSCWAQSDSTKANKLSMDLQFLAHGEICAGGLPKPPITKPDSPEADLSAFLLGRTRLSLNYERNWLEAKITLQNNAVWGMRNNMSVDLYEGWVKMKSKNGFFTKIGRVALSYDDERIIGPNDFATASLSHDVGMVGYEGHGHQIHGIFAFNQNSENVYEGTYYDNGSQYYKTMQTVWYHYDFPKFPLGASLLFMNMGIQAGEEGDTQNPPSTKYQQMWGTYLKYHPKYLTLEASYYRQTGKTVNEKKHYKPIKAWMASLKATITPTDHYGFQLGYDYLSGDDFVPVPYGGTAGLPFHEVLKGFSPLYGSRTKFYGILDFFYTSAYINGFTPGLQNVYVGAFGNPLPKMRLSVDYHYLAVATNLSELSNTLGHNIDFNAEYAFSKDVSLSVNYSMMAGTETMTRLKQENGSKYAHWAWFSLLVSPTLFTTRF
ncbi:MAG: hypothetical protein J6W21_00050 [Bacteroidaceae bacterium]|nr:hypothetical protein [Bacteroidaceae bacterium]